MSGDLEANMERRRTSWHGGGYGPCSDLYLHLTGMERDREENLCSSLIETRPMRSGSHLLFWA